MKNVVIVCLVALVMVFVVGCATPYPMGNFFTNLKLPVDATSKATNYTKVGTAECVSYLGLIATGDCSINTAMKNGGIKQIHHVDWEVENILGVVGKYKLTVYGE